MKYSYPKASAVADGRSAFIVWSTGIDVAVCCWMGDGRT